MSVKASPKGSLKARKTAARLFAVQAVYQAIQNKEAPNKLYQEFITHRIGMDLEGGLMVTPDQPLFRDILSGVTDRWGDLQQIISPRLKVSHDVEPLLTSILICGAYELMAHQDIDAPIIISDYLNITSSFFESSEPKLVNAVLDSLSKELRG
jgi:transcription antitermination protein NusB